MPNAKKLKRKREQVVVSREEEHKSVLEVFEKAVNIAEYATGHVNQAQMALKNENYSEAATHIAKAMGSMTGFTYHHVPSPERLIEAFENASDAVIDALNVIEQIRDIIEKDPAISVNDVQLLLGYVIPAVNNLNTLSTPTQAPVLDINDAQRRTNIAIQRSEEADSFLKRGDFYNAAAKATQGMAALLGGLSSNTLPENVKEAEALVSKTVKATNQARNALENGDVQKIAKFVPGALKKEV